MKAFCCSDFLQPRLGQGNALASLVCFSSWWRWSVNGVLKVFAQDGHVNGEPRSGEYLNQHAEWLVSSPGRCCDTCRGRDCVTYPAGTTPIEVLPSCCSSGSTEWPGVPRSRGSRLSERLATPVTIFHSSFSGLSGFSSVSSLSFASMFMSR